MEENICKWSNQEGINLQNTQTVHAALYKKKKNNQKNRQKIYIYISLRQTDGQKAHKKMLNITNYKINANQNYSEVSPHTGLNGCYQKVY